MLQLTFESFPVLQTKRLQLRQFVLADAQAFFELLTHEKYQRFLDRSQPLDIEEVRTKIQTKLTEFDNNEAISWVLSPIKSDAFLGTISFWRIDKAHFRAEIGYGIHPYFQQQGYMSEAIDAVVNYGFEQMNIHSIEANVNPANIASCRLLEKHGFIQEAYFRENFYFNGKFLDSVIYSLVKSSISN
jgi:[ribosomal protein S5]-alanine N-acetyltransferase